MDPTWTQLASELKDHSDIYIAKVCRAREVCLLAERNGLTRDGHAILPSSTYCVITLSSSFIPLVKENSSRLIHCGANKWRPNFAATIYR